MSVAVTCPRCGGPIRSPDRTHTEWRCDVDGLILPFHRPQHITMDVVETLCAKVKIPLWCLWSSLPAWTVTGIGWVGDERSGIRATAMACSGPAPLEGGSADVILVAEEPGVGLGCRLAGVPGADPGPGLAENPPQVKLFVAGHPTPLWVMNAPPDRSAYVGEAKGIWLYAVAWPALAGYVLDDQVILRDLADSLPSQLVFGAPSPYLHGEQ